ncbi:hypothetical protein [Afipia sp. GAS231]|uniref:hypothetical protein n=1 Tax=Afipia sp. GAS231 TaxID=1882747 RepID=UPI00087AACE2|nr:hypothetical protein [Afipia sp. GAS231]SDO85635.1 hypothetical protein SAMN05444050_5185 [Afipia sp. GAS231]
MSWQRATAAYPLVRLHDASVSLDKWLRFVRRHCGPSHQRAGLIAIRDCRGIVHALFSYRVDFDLHNRKRLCVANLIVAHIPGSKIEEAVATSTRNISAELGCHTISAEQPFRPASAPWKRCPTAEALTRRIGLSRRLH